MILLFFQGAEPPPSTHSCRALLGVGTTFLLLIAEVFA